MSDNLSADGKRLFRRTFATSSTAPWWVQWILKAVIVVAVIFGTAWLIDHIWVDWRGQPAWATCSLLALMPWGLAPVVGLMLGVAGIITFIMSKRPAGIGLLVLGVGFYSLPEILMAGSLGTACPWIPLRG